MVQLDLKLSDSLAREAQAAGLLTQQAIEQLLREEIRRRGGRLYEAAGRLAAPDVPPLTGAETQAAREAKRVYMPTYQFTVVIEPDEERFHAYVPALPGCHTFGDTLDEARANIAEAVQVHVESMQQDGEPIPTEHEPLFITRLSVPAAA
jgi:predicted RNase H-like HicB family nuclease